MTEIEEAEDLVRNYRSRFPLQGNDAWLAALAEDNLKVLLSKEAKVKELARKKRVTKALHRRRYKDNAMRKYKESSCDYNTLAVVLGTRFEL